MRVSGNLVIITLCRTGVGRMQEGLRRQPQSGHARPPAAPAAPGAKTVQWPELTKLDELAHQCAGLIEKKDTARLRDIAPQVRAALEAAINSEPPKDVADPELVLRRQEDLRSLASPLANPGHLGDGELFAILKSLTPLVEATMTAAGCRMPTQRPGLASTTKATDTITANTMAMTTELAVELRDCRKTLGHSGADAVQFYVNEFCVERGERVALTGPSGCGKSTLLNLVSGLVRPDSGSIKVLGTDVAALSTTGLDTFRGASIGFVYQTFNLIEAFTARENVLMGMRFGRAIAHSERNRRAGELLERVGLSHRLHARPSRLSVGSASASPSPAPSPTSPPSSWPMNPPAPSTPPWPRKFSHYCLTCVRRAAPCSW